MGLVCEVTFSRPFTITRFCAHHRPPSRATGASVGLPRCLRVGVTPAEGVGASLSQPVKLHPRSRHVSRGCRDSTGVNHIPNADHRACLVWQIQHLKLATRCLRQVHAAVLAPLRWSSSFESWRSRCARSHASYRLASPLTLSRSTPRRSWCPTDFERRVLSLQWLRGNSEPCDIDAAGEVSESLQRAAAQRTHARRTPHAGGRACHQQQLAA